MYPFGYVKPFGFSVLSTGFQANGFRTYLGLFRFSWGGESTWSPFWAPDSTH